MCPVISISQPSAAALGCCCYVPSEVWLAPQVFDLSLMITGEVSFGIICSHSDFFVRLLGLIINQIKLKKR